MAWEVFQRRRFGQGAGGTPGRGGAPRSLPDKRPLIAVMWQVGHTIHEIAEATGRNEGYIRCEMKRMRASGWDLPYRYRRRAVT